MARGQDRISPERAKHLERNRIAANKCRQKKKREHQQIQSCLQDETARHDTLMAELNSLREEIWTLKNTVFAHAGCNDRHINQKLANMSESLTGTNPEQHQLCSPAFSSHSLSDESMAGGSGDALDIDPDLPGSLPLAPMDPGLYDDGTYPPGFSFDNFLNVESL